MEEIQKKEFTGVWIPADVVEDSKLTWTDRAVYAEISCFRSGCFMSNAFIANRVGITERQVSKIITKLKALDYIKQTGFDGRKRYLIATQHRTLERGRLELEFYPATNQSSTIDNNIDNNIDTITNKLVIEPKGYGKPEINEMFNLWEEIVGYRITSNIQKNRFAINNLIKQNSKEEIKKLLQVLAISKSDQYAPRIEDFVALQSKMNALALWVHRQQNDKPQPNNYDFRTK